MGCSMVLNRDLGNSHLVLRRGAKGTWRGERSEFINWKSLCSVDLLGKLRPVITAYSLDTVL